ncbi:DBH-like monooxygenase protein 2 homolog isoform X2 [Toxotes jaculatrix]|uniref:DBH-like monooxygenase protein 2 homolog isoform X2 n=1 Tax=Toxotes jaculatrix TaxID=941984 RepID=UPI001B3A7DAF|nr:DBH-like monooxygenase protein 2 homolog isoform X2 [Toxotes jaculatrix]
MRSLLPFLCLFLAGTKGVGASDPTVPFMEYLDQDNLVCLKWGFDDLQGSITFMLAVNTTGWVGFGLSPNGGMKGSDIVIGGLGPSGSYFTDRYATGNSMPVVDTQQSYTLLSMNEREGQTIMTFQRSIQTCDDQDFYITAQSIKLIYAYGTTDEITYHGARRGTKEINLLNYKSRTTIPNSDYLSATVDNITVPPIHTYYHCKVMNFPNLSTKHHIYQIQPVIEHHDIVHHMLLYSCPPFVTQPYDKPCFMGDIGDACFGVVAAWGVGGEVFELPENAGIPIGGGDSDMFYRLEIHYNNPNLDAGRTDSSGLRLYYTAQLRQHDVGILTTGVQPFEYMNYVIPPKAPEFQTYGVCNTSLFSQNSVPDLQMFAVLLHTHLAGMKVRVGHYRDGKQIDFLGVDENYNFEIQQIVSLGKIKTIKQNDEIAVECTYNTVSRTGVTKMGLGTTDEMCLAFLLYYPAIEITSCVSYPNTMSLSNTSYQMFEETTSDLDEIAEYQSLLNTLPQIQVISSDDSNYTVYEKGIIREMMKTPTVTCQNPNASSRLYTPWILETAGIILSLLWIAIM